MLEFMQPDFSASGEFVFKKGFELFGKLGNIAAELALAVTIFAHSDLVPFFFDKSYTSVPLIGKNFNATMDGGLFENSGNLNHDGVSIDKCHRNKKRQKGFVIS